MLIASTQHKCAGVRLSQLATLSLCLPAQPSSGIAQMRHTQEASARTSRKIQREIQPCNLHGLEVGHMTSAERTRMQNGWSSHPEAQHALRRHLQPEEADDVAAYQALRRLKPAR